MRKRTKRLFILFPVAALLAAWGSSYLPFPAERLNPAPLLSLRVEDRNGQLLREVLSDEGGRCRWIRLAEVSPLLLKATIASEDRAFFSHSGIDPLAIIRAISQNLRSGRTVSGASTITQQLVRNITPGRRTLARKLWEAWLAVRLEHSLSKEEILTQYLNRVPYGNRAFGIEAAARLYFDKPAGDLSLAESAFLAGLPRAPHWLNPYRRRAEAVKRQRDILKAMARLAFITPAELERALAEKLIIVPAAVRFRAPHFCDMVLARLGPDARGRLSRVRTTLDLSLQAGVEKQVANHLRRLAGRDITNAAVVVLDNSTDEVLSLVGSLDFFDERHQGQVNGALALRQPGSALKPFTYALALEREFTAASLVNDAPDGFPTATGAFRPRNYDRRFHGQVRMRVALACSYNVPAVSLLASLGEDILFRRLKSLGFDSLDRESSHYGLGLTLGNGEVSLLELARAYAALSRGGVVHRERIRLREVDRNGGAQEVDLDRDARRVFSEKASFIITHILADRDARIPAFGYLTPLALPFPAAAKTGTSKDYRDNWTVGYTPRHTVAVWVGNFDGRPMRAVSGITGCGPLFHDVMLLLADRESGQDFREPEGIVRRAVCPRTGLLPGDHCPGHMEELFIRGTEPKTRCRSLHLSPGEGAGDFFASPAGPENPGELRVLFPQEGDVFKIDPVLRPKYQTIKLRARPPADAGIQAVEWWVNGRRAGSSPRPFSLSWALSPGRHTVKAVARTRDGRLESRTVTFLVLS